MSDSNFFLRLANPGIDGLSPYSPGKPVAELERELGLRDVIKLASNENPYGASPKAHAAIQSALLGLSRYPDGGGFELKRAIAVKTGLEPDCITLGNGSNDVLELIARTFLTVDCEALFSDHAFAVYGLVTQAAGAKSCIAPAADGSGGPRYGHDLEAMAERIGPATRVVFIANPNNPTGTYLAADTLRDFIAALPKQVLCVVDEAYFEYVGQKDYPDTSRWLAAFPNLIVTRTFSKAHGLAALRIGYSLSHPDVAELLNRVRQPFNINSLALAAAAAALEDDDFVRRSVQLNRAGQRQLCGAMERLGFDYIPSVANFLSIDVKREAAPVFQALLREGVIVRPIANYGLPRHLRVTVGREEENERFVLALAKVSTHD